MFSVYYNIPTVLPRPVHLPVTFRVISLFAHIPIRGPNGTVIGVRRFRVAWNLHDPARSVVHTASSLSTYYERD